MKKTLTTLILISLISLGVVCLQPIKAQSASDITINADGRVYPKTAPIEVKGNVYTLTNYTYGSLSLEKSNIIFDGKGHTLDSVTNEQFGIRVNDVSNVTIKNVTVRGTSQGATYGIALINASNTIVANNTVTNIGWVLAMNGIAYDGIYVEGGNSNVIAGNKLETNICGMAFYQTSFNLIYGNSITDLSNPWGIYSDGIYFTQASNNTIYHNNFKNHIGEYVSEAGGEDSINTWDNGYPFGGNYWGDYQTRYPDAVEIGNSGIGNTYYFIDYQSKDQYPLMKPFTTATYLLQTTPPKVLVQSPLAQTYNESSVSLVFSEDKAANWMGYSLDGQQNVTVTGNGTLANIMNGVHTLKVYANDTFGNMGASQTINFTMAMPEETKPFPTAIIAAVSVAAVAVVVASLLVYFKKRDRGYNK